jgi:hypothetical protein
MQAAHEAATSASANAQRIVRDKESLRLIDN